MLTVVKNGRFTGVQYPPQPIGEARRIKAHHEGQGEAVIDWPKLTRDADDNITDTPSDPLPEPRQGRAEQRLKQMLNIPAVKNTKTLDDARAYVDGQVNDLATAKEMMARLMFAVINTGRAVNSEDDEIFPDDE